MLADEETDLDAKPETFRETVDVCGESKLVTCMGKLIGYAMLVLSMPAIVSCTAIPVYKQQRLAKANMIFDDTNAFAFSSRLQPQSEPGTSASGGAQGGGCTACQ